MERVLKKFLLLTILIYELFKQLFLGIFLCLFNRTKKINKNIVMVSIGVIGILFFFGMIMPKADLLASNHNNHLVSNNSSSEIVMESVLDINNTLDKSTNKDSKPISNLAYDLHSSNVSIDNIEKNLKEADVISFQATAIADSKVVGRDEPFAPLAGPQGLGVNTIPGMPPVEGAKQPSAAEIAKQKAELRRNEIRESINNNVILKGIVLNKNKSRPMAVIQLNKGDGNLETKAVRPGEQLYLPNCVAKVSNISENRVGLQSEDVKVDRYLPEINDEESTGSTAPVPSAAASPSGSSGLMPPPIPGNIPMPPQNKAGTGAQNGSSMGDAKKKIDEIDKLLNSF